MKSSTHSENKTIDNTRLEISTAKNVTLDGCWFGENVNSPFSRLYYMKNGGGRIVVRGDVVNLQPNHIYLVPAGLKFSHYPDGIMEKLYFHFNIYGPDGYDMLRNIGCVKCIPCDSAYIKEMYRLFHSEALSDSLMLKSHIFSDIAVLMQNENEQLPDTRQYSEWVWSAIKIINAHPSLKITGAYLARKLFVSESFLAKRFKSEAGLTIGDYIDQMILASAQKALIETDDTISFISDQYEFNDKYYFAKWFKKHTGETPTSYRRRMKIY